MIRNAIGFFVAPIITPLFVVVAVLIGYRIVTTSLVDAILVPYIGAVIFGLPMVAFARLVGWNRSYQYMAIGAVVGIGTYFMIWEVLPIVAAYRDGRYDVYQALRAVTFLDFSTVAIWSAILGCLSGGVFWLVARPDQ